MPHRRKWSKTQEHHDKTNLKRKQLVVRCLFLLLERQLCKLLCLPQHVVLLLQRRNSHHMLVDQHLALGCRALRLQNHLEL
jgi:hypothetical protein